MVGIQMAGIQIPTVVYNNLIGRSVNLWAIIFNFTVTI